jgi:hypothetical protein
MPKCLGKSQSGIGISTSIQLLQSRIGISVSGSVPYRWSRISPAFPGLCKPPLVTGTVFESGNAVLLSYHMASPIKYIAHLEKSSCTSVISKHKAAE